MADPQPGRVGFAAGTATVENPARASSSRSSSRRRAGSQPQIRRAHRVSKALTFLRGVRDGKDEGGSGAEAGSELRPGGTSCARARPEAGEDSRSRVWHLPQRRDYPGRAPSRDCLSARTRALDRRGDRRGRGRRGGLEARAACRRGLAVNRCRPWSAGSARTAP